MGITLDSCGAVTDQMIGIKLLGFKDQSELLFEDNIKHSLFIHPDETVGTLVLRHVGIAKWVS